MHITTNGKKFLALTLVTATVSTVISPVFAQKPVSGKRLPNVGSWVELQTGTDKLQYLEGEPIKVTLKATNIQEKDAYLHFTSGQRFDFSVFKLGEKETAYTWSANKMFNMMVSTVKLKLAERQTFTAEIGDETGGLKPGKYRLESQLTNSSRIQGRTIEFTVLPKVAQSEYPGAKVTAKTDKSVYKTGEAVRVDFTLQNNRLRPTTFNFRSGQNYDVFVKNAAGETVWNWSANIRFLMVSRPVTFAAGEKRDFSVTWNGTSLPDHKIVPGIYTVQASFASDPPVEATPIEIHIQ